MHHVYSGICIYWFLSFIRNKVFNFLVVVSRVRYASRMTQHWNVKCFSSAHVSYLSLTADIAVANHRVGDSKWRVGRGRERGPKILCHELSVELQSPKEQYMTYRNNLRGVTMQLLWKSLHTGGEMVDTIAAWSLLWIYIKTFNKKKTKP